MSANKLRIAILLSIVMVLIATACGPAPTPEVRIEEATVIVLETQEIEKVITATPEPRPEVEQVFVVGLYRDTGPLNPHDYRSAHAVLDMLYEPLVRYQADGTIGPWLAESWEVSDDGRTWTFHLRQDVTFTDGTPFNAEAAKWNLEQWVGTERHGWLASSKAISSIEAADEYTIVLNMDEFYEPTLQDLTLVRPVRFLSPNAVDADGNFVEPIGTGPFKVEEYVPIQRTVFVPNEDYWGTKPKLEKVIMEVIPDAQTRIAALLSGEVHLIGGEYIGSIALESIPVLQRNPDVQVLTAEGTSTYLLQTNFAKPPFDDIRLRQALNYAANRELIVSSLFLGLASPAQGVFPDNIPYVTHPHPEMYAYDTQKSKELLAEAGWTPGADGILEKDGERLEVSMIVDAAQFPQAKSMAEVLQAQFKEVGIEMAIRLLDSGGFSEALRTDDYDLAINYTYGSPYDPQSTLTAVFRSGYAQYAETGGLYFISQKLDTLIDEILTTVDPAERQARYNEMWNYLDENAAVVPIVHMMRIYAVSKDVQGFHLGGTEYDLDLTGVTMGGN